jgi:hypothetical protein
MKNKLRNILLYLTVIFLAYFLGKGFGKLLILIYQFFSYQN